MTSIEELNNQLSQKLLKELDECKNAMKKLDSKYPEVMLAKKQVLNFSMDIFRKEVDQRLENLLIAEWLNYQTNDGKEVDHYDMIYFEYHEDTYDDKEAYSYGIYDMINYKLTIEPHFYGYDYKFLNWEAGLGLILAPFEATKPISYTSIDNDERFELISYKDEASGYELIWRYVHALCKYIFNKAFKAADLNGLFGSIKIKQGGLFMYSMHDGGSSLDVFYIKK